jgi:hypothetical protein
MNNASHKADKPAFIEKQYAFAAHIRNPDINPRPDDIESRRMDIYSELFYNNIESFISNGFPVLRELTSDEDWHAMVRDFMHRHHCKSPYFMDISEEFLDYLQNERDQSDDPEWMLELAHYEWVELALSVLDDETSLDNIDPNGDLMEQVPALSPLAWPLSYQYPVHRIGPDYKPAAPEPVHLIVYRDNDDDITFLEINPVTARLLEMITSDTPVIGAQMLEQIAEEIEHPVPSTVIEGGLSILNDLRERSILTGTRRS